MISVDTRVIGGEAVAKRLADVASGIQPALRRELSEIGREIVSRAQALAPKRTGIMASKVISYFGERKRMRSSEGRMVTGTIDPTYADGRIVFNVQPTGSVAHLMERGVNTIRDAHFRRVVRRNVKVWTRKGEKTIRELKGRAYIQSHQLTIAARPFFIPAVQSVGGNAGINERLQGALTALAASGKAA